MIESIPRKHLTRYPLLQIQNLYKLLHQAALGSEHALTDRLPVERWLRRELAEMGEGIPDDSLTVSLLNKHPQAPGPNGVPRGNRKKVKLHFSVSQWLDSKL